MLQQTRSDDSDEHHVHMPLGCEDYSVSLVLLIFSIIVIKYPGGFLLSGSSSGSLGADDPKGLYLCLGGELLTF